MARERDETQRIGPAISAEALKRLDLWASMVQQWVERKGLGLGRQYGWF